MSRAIEPTHALASEAYITIKNKHLLVIYAIPTRGFTAAVSVFELGTPPAKPLIAKNVLYDFDAVTLDHNWTHLAGDQPLPVFPLLTLVPEDILI